MATHSINEYRRKRDFRRSPVMLWDVGLWQLDGRNDDEQIDFIFTGTKLKGA